MPLCEYELACRILEELTGRERPDGMTPKEIIEALDQKIMPETSALCSMIVSTAATYFNECFGVAGRQRPEYKNLN